ncbi:MAG: cupin domain-containing protein [Acidobacteria bacterium]|nr:cupin domain-containing protein [Acidobacteriota bacterium]MDA1234540.1 cupin domain-containing protein [Acidobacteriota bacterium]
MTSKTFLHTALVATLAGAAALSGAANAGAPESSTRLLTANFASRQVVQVEVGDFHFKPGQVAPIHTHAAPAVGYVAKGMIIYQVEGEKPQILEAGDVFYEPVGPRILRFDNASATEEAIFLDFNLEQVDEPFIVFEEQPTEAIDRRTLPTIDVADTNVDQVDVYSSELAPSGTLHLRNQESTLGLVSEGIIEIRIEGEPTQRMAAGESFYLTTAGVPATVVNASAEVPAKVITFRLR